MPHGPRGLNLGYWGLVETSAPGRVSDRGDSSVILPFWSALLSLGLSLIVRSNILTDHCSSISIWQDRYNIRCCQDALTLKNKVDNWNDLEQP